MQMLLALLPQQCLRQYRQHQQLLLLCLHQYRQRQQLLLLCLHQYHQRQQLLLRLHQYR